MTRRLVIGMLTVIAVPVSAAEVDYLRDVKPLLREKCYACHAAIHQRSGLRLDTAAAIRKGGESGPAIVTGKPHESLLINAVTGKAGFRMPPEKEGTPLTPEQIGILSRWIEQGAAGPEDEQPQANPRQWWSYRPIVRPDVPPGESGWSHSPIDRFIANRREAQGIGHAGPAAGSIWLRRVYLDLIGLPPTRRELHAFLADESDAAFEKVVDDLLSRPQYGERWGRHWMDIWRYSDWYGSRGINEIRYSQRHIWRWRDWIINSLNDDTGYDQMILEMLAGDELAADDPDVLVATGYLGRNWYKFDRNVWMFETVERTGEAFLGLKLRCCRCHDHKYDPVLQEEYYRFRAFFEPHDVRTDLVSALTPTVKDATLGQVPADGLARVFDKQLDVPTYRFQRGDDRFPDKSKPLSPGVPAALGGAPVKIETVNLPPAGYYPALRPGLRESYIATAEKKIQDAQSALAEQTQKAAAIAARIATREKSDASTDAPVNDVFLTDDFSRARPETWEVVNGDWVYEDGRLVEKTVTSFATMVTKQTHPADFRARLKYRPLQPGTYRSVGFSFDFVDKGNSQDVYTSTGDSSQSVQAFHRTGGGQVYPPAGIVKTKLTVGEIATLEVEVLGSKLTIDLNGERKLDYALPVPRKEGKFALWVHAGSAEFLELEIKPLRETLDTLRRKHGDGLQAAATTVRQLHIARAERDAVAARIAADVAVHFKHEKSDESARDQLKLDASRAEWRTAVLQAELDVDRIKHQLAASGATSESGKTLQAKLTAAEKTLAAAKTAVENPDGKYTPIGETWPQTSTGRRLALAKWIASESNPRTARVAVNHIWNRHFGRPLVETTDNFGLNGAQPTHPELLDWLASELIDNDWQMKPIHRQIVLSSTYRMSSRPGILKPQPSDPTALRRARDDPTNRYFWRMHSRRVEAEVARDSILSLAGTLDPTRGGPEIPETDGEKVLRRSVYFRNTPNEKMPFLEVFDVADPNSCYRRKESVVPHQALALMNSGLAQDHARTIAAQIEKSISKDEPEPDNSRFVVASFETVLCRSPTDAELNRAVRFLSDDPVATSGTEKFAGGGSSQRAPAASPAVRARENLVHVLLLHNDFVTVR